MLLQPWWAMCWQPKPTERTSYTQVSISCFYATTHMDPHAAMLRIYNCNQSQLSLVCTMLAALFRNARLYKDFSQCQ